MLTKIKSLLKTGVLCIPVFFIFSCSSSQKNWVTKNSPTSKKTCCPVKNSFREIELEILETSSGKRMYANVHSLPLKSTNGKVILKVTIEGETNDYEADLLLGGQRILIPDFLTQKISECLHKQQPIKISVGRYSRTF